MADEPIPTPSPAPAPTPAAAPPPNPILESVGRLDRSTQMMAGAGIVVAVAGLVGIIIDTWRFDYAGLLMVVAGLGGTALAWMAAERKLPAMPLSAADLLLAAAAVAAALGVLALVTILADLDQLGDEYGGILGVVTSAAVAVAGLAMLYWALAASGGPASVWRTATSSGRGPLIGLAGAGLAYLGWVGNLSIGVWTFSASAVVVTLITLAGVVLFVAARSGGTAKPVPLSWIAAVGAGLAALVLADHFGIFSRLMNRNDLGVEHWLIFGAYGIGVLALLGGSILLAIDERAAQVAPTPAADAAAQPEVATPPIDRPGAGG